MSIVRVALRTTVILASFTAGALSIAACQGTAEPRDAAAGFMTRNSDYGLHYVDTGEGAKLAYGQADSELMSLMLECARGSGTVEISDVAHGSSEITLVSGGRRSDFEGAVAAAPIAPVLIADATVDAPALLAFRQTGRVEVTNGKLRYDIAADETEKPSVERFFAMCERPA